MSLKVNEEAMGFIPKHIVFGEGEVVKVKTYIRENGIEDLYRDAVNHLIDSKFHNFDGEQIQFLRDIGVDVEEQINVENK